MLTAPAITRMTSPSRHRRETPSIPWETPSAKPSPIRYAVASRPGVGGCSEGDLTVDPAATS